VQIGGIWLPARLDGTVQAVRLRTDVTRKRTRVGVGQRTQEFGVRLAIGATPGGIRWSVFRHGTAIVGAGIAVGLFAALALGRLLESILYGVSATDPLPYLVVPLALMLTALLAGVIPARRATKVGPVEALRYE
jgi:ABC-type antimicrobial peptide transport system permease subunit